MRLKEQLTNITQFSCFSLLTPSERFQLDEDIIYKNIDKGDVVFDQGEICERLYFLTKGSVKIFSIDEVSHKEHISSIEHPISVFGECCLFGMPEKAFSAVAIEDNTKIFSISIKVFKNLMKYNFEFNLAVLQLVGEKFKKAQSRLNDFATKDARSRIVEFLKSNAEEVGTQIGYETLVKHGLTQTDIAIYTGTSRQTVTTVLNDLKKTNQIYLKRKSILIRDLASLN